MQGDIHQFRFLLKKEQLMSSSTQPTQGVQEQLGRMASRFSCLGLEFSKAKSQTRMRAVGCSCFPSSTQGKDDLSADLDVFLGWGHFPNTKPPSMEGLKAE